MAITKAQKWGNSDGLRLPGIRKVRRSKYDLAELVARIPKGYKVQEVDSGPRVGKEEW